jgi:hypothetical protein
LPTNPGPSFGMAYGNSKEAWALVGGEPDVSQDSLDHRRLVNQRHEAQPPTAARTGQDVDAKCPAHQLGPLIHASPGGLCAARLPVFPRCSLASIDSVCDPRNDRPSPRGTRREHTIVQNQVHPRPRHQHGQPLEQPQRIEAQMRRAIRPAVSQRQPDLAVTGPVSLCLDICPIYPSGNFLRFRLKHDEPDSPSAGRLLIRKHSFSRAITTCAGNTAR